MKLHNPYKPGTQCYALLEAFRANGYRLRKSWMVQPEKMGLFIQSPQTRESDLRKDGFVIDPEKPDHLEGNVNDLWHVMKFDPFNPAHADRAPKDGKIHTAESLPESLLDQYKKKQVEDMERTLYGDPVESTESQSPKVERMYCSKHDCYYNLGEGCWKCAGERLKA